MIRRPPRSTRTDTLFPYTTLFRSGPVTFLHAICGWIIRLVTARFHQFSDAFAHLLKLALYDFQLLCRGVEGFGAGCTVGNEMALIFRRRNQGLAGRDADHNGARSEERRGGKERGRTGRAGWSRYKKK